MQRIWTTQLRAHAGQRIRLNGWLHHLRRLRQTTFLLLRDGKGVAQVVVEDPAVAATLGRLHHESVLQIEGPVHENPRAPGGAELHQPVLTVVVPSGSPAPVDLSRPMLQAQLPTVLDHAAVALRHPRMRAGFAIASASMTGFRAALRARGFVEIQTPKIVGTATESGASVFGIDYFGRRAYLAQSPQLYKQIMVGVFERVFEIGPVFRAEPHDTPRHLNEYVSMDAEMGFIADHTEVMNVLTGVLAGMLEAVRDEAAPALTVLDIHLPPVVAPIPVLHFSEAREMLLGGMGEDISDQGDFAPQHERWLGGWARRVHGSEYLFVVGYPTARRPFYTHPDPHDPEWSNSFDLLFRGMELVTGGQRLHRYDDYRAALLARGLAAEPLAGYLEAFQHGMPPHGGFAIGLERWVASLVGAANVRETTLFPRDQQRLFP